MNVVAVNSSPKMDKGITALILNPFLEGMREAGAEVELFYTKKLSINPCLGRLNCFVRGKCIQSDDMDMLLPRMKDADLWVFSTPVYWSGIVGPMKNLIDRMTAFGHPVFGIRDGHSYHMVREDLKRGKAVLVSSCGFWELDNFDLLVDFMKRFCRQAEREFAGALLRPQSMPFMGMLRMGKPVGDILDAARDAGRQLVKDGRMAPETLKTIGRPLMPVEKFVEVANQKWKQAIDAGKSPFDGT